METQLPDMILTIIVLSFWFLFPIGMFLSVSHVDKNTDQVVRLGHLRHDSIDSVDEVVEEEVTVEDNIIDLIDQRRIRPRHRRDGGFEVSYRH